MKKYLAEFVGTFALVFAGTGAIVIDEVSNGAVTHVGIGFTFGLVGMAVICAVGDVFGAHLNPVVTIGFFTARRFPARQLAPYVMSQLFGALIASMSLHLLFPSNRSLGRTYPIRYLSPVIHSRISPNDNTDVRDSERVEQWKRKEYRRWFGDRSSHRPGSLIRRTSIRSFNESGQVASTSFSWAPTQWVVDLFARSRPSAAY